VLNAFHKKMFFTFFLGFSSILFSVQAASQSSDNVPVFYISKKVIASCLNETQEMQLRDKDTIMQELQEAIDSTAGNPHGVDFIYFREHQGVAVGFVKEFIEQNPKINNVRCCVVEKKYFETLRALEEDGW
jgi:hypothetical protein